METIVVELASFVVVDSPFAVPAGTPLAGPTAAAVDFPFAGSSVGD